MKKFITLLNGLVLLTSLSALAAAAPQQATVELFTTGPDLYTDGSPVALGEQYLLVYVKAGATFAGLHTDGTLVDPTNNSKVFTSQAVADEVTGGTKCGFVPVQYPTDLYPAGGSWVVVLLDTRRADGSIGGLVAAAGSATAVIATDPIAGPRTLATDGGVVATAITPSPDDGTRPHITAIRKTATEVNLDVADASARALYRVETTTDLTAGEWQPLQGQERVQGLDIKSLSMADEAAPDAPATTRFYRVIKQ